MAKRGLLVIISGPSGVGKGTLCNHLVAEDTGLCLSISATTRSPRTGEVHGVNYFFVSKEEFRAMAEQEALLEWAAVFGNYYGTPRAYVERELDRGKNVILEIDVQGGLQVKRLMPEAVMVFILPPNLGELEARIRKRATDSNETIAKRLAMVTTELQQLASYDYAVVNDEIGQAVSLVQAIIAAEECRVQRVLLEHELFRQKGDDE